MGTENIIKERNRALFNRWASTYDFNLFQYWMKRFQVPAIQEINFSAKPRVLDISCGTGQLLRSLVNAGEGKFYGIDLAEKMLEKARTKLPAKVKLLKADVHALPFNENTFDYTITTEAFHHYYDQKKALREMSRVTKKRGKVIVVDINFFLRPIHFLFQKLEPGNVKINSRQEMKELFEQAKLKVEKQQRSFLFAIMTVGVKS